MDIIKEAIKLSCLSTEMNPFQPRLFDMIDVKISKQFMDKI